MQHKERKRKYKKMKSQNKSLTKDSINQIFATKKYKIKNGEYGRLMKIDWPHFTLKDKIRDVCYLTKIKSNFERFSEMLMKGQEDRKHFLEDMENLGWENEFLSQFDDNSALKNLAKISSFKLLKMQKPTETLWRYYNTDNLNKIITDLLTPDKKVHFIDTKNVLIDYIRDPETLANLKNEFDSFDN